MRLAVGRHPHSPVVCSDDDSMMFEIAPTSLWLEDYSAVKTLFDAWRAAGVRDVRAYFAEDTARVRACAAGMRVIKVNARRCRCSRRRTFAHLAANLDRVFRDEMLTSHLEELVQLWDGDRRVPATPSTIRCRAAPRHSARRARCCRATSPTGRGCWWRSTTSASAKARAATLAAERGLCARAVRPFAGVAVGRGFQRASRSLHRRGARLRDRRLPHLHRRSSGIRRRAA